MSDARFPLKFTEVKEWDEGFQLWAQPDVGPVPLWQTGECVFTVSRHRGLVFSAYMGYAPDLRYKDVATVGADVGRAATLDAYARYKPFARATIGRTDLILHPPRFFRPREFTEEHFQLGIANIAIPMYVTYVGDTESYVGSYGSHSRFQFVYVDARTGRAIAIFDGSGGPLSLLTPKDVSPDISAWTSAHPAGAPDAHAVRFLPLDGRGAWDFQGEPVLFQNGEDFVYGLYDSWSRILKVERKAGAEWFRVNGEFGEKLVPLRERPPFGARRFWR